MIASLTGKVQDLGANHAVLDVGGVGYFVSITPKDSAKLRHGDNAFLLISMIVREDAMLLFGFLESEQRDLFDVLRSVSGVGPKLAQSILSQLEPFEIASAVANEEDRVFSAISGIGPKTAKLLVVALSGRLRGVSTDAKAGVKSANSEVRDSVVLALSGLGIPEKDAAAAVESVLGMNPLASRDVALKATLAAIGASKRAQ
ncbi:MAG: Holliday junction branch migration protein RuvA [Micrococcales bacterium]